MLRVAIVDDHEEFRRKLRALLETDPRMAIVVEARSGEEFLTRARKTGIDAACMDISMPGINGIETTRRLLAFMPAVRVIGLSAYADPLYVEAMLQAGAAGYFTKADADEALLRALHSATVERPCFGPGVSPDGALQPGAATAADGPPADAHPVRLAARELEVLTLIGKGWPSARIGESLAMAPAIVDVYHRNIARKLQLAGTSELAAYAVRHGYGARSG